MVIGSKVILISIQQTVEISCLNCNISVLKYQSYEKSVHRSELYWCNNPIDKILPPTIDCHTMLPMGQFWMFDNLSYQVYLPGTVVQHFTRLETSFTVSSNNFTLDFTAAFSLPSTVHIL